MTMQQATPRSIAPSFPPVASPHLAAHRAAGHRYHVGPTGVVHRATPSNTPRPRASNAPLAWLATADVPPSAKRLGTFLAKHARYATATEGDRKVAEGEIFCYWPQRNAGRRAGLWRSPRQDGLPVPA